MGAEGREGERVKREGGGEGNGPGSKKQTRLVQVLACKGAVREAEHRVRLRTCNAAGTFGSLPAADVGTNTNGTPTASCL